MLDGDLLPSAQRAADFLLGTIEQDVLPVATTDLWEEREGQHAFTAASTVGGLRAAGAMARRHELRWPSGTKLPPRSCARVSLLGLTWPFAGSIKAVSGCAPPLRPCAPCPAGSLRRYTGDTHAGGNRWVLAALWLGLWHRQVGDDEGLQRALAYALTAQTKLGLLPEQVTEDGEPGWVLPLAWSHAMLLLAARPELSLR